jgi:hypothetical protein
MTNFEFKVTKLFPGTENQKKVGICATFSMNIENSDGVLVSMNDMMLRKTKEGQYYIESPFRTYEGKDKSGNAAQKKVNYVKIFPEQKNWGKQDALVGLVLDELNNPKNNSPRENNNSNNNSNNNYNKGTSRPAPAKQSSNDPW